MVKLSEMQKQVKDLNREANKVYQNKLFSIPGSLLSKNIEYEFIICKVRYVDLLDNRVEIEYGKRGYLTSLKTTDFETYSVESHFR